ARNRSHCAFASHQLRVLEVAPVARSRVPVITLHLVAFTGDHGATHTMRRALEAADESMAVSIHSSTTMCAERGAFGVAHARIDRECGRFAGSSDFDRSFR